MAIGRPIELTPNIATKNISSLATADQTEFTVTGGYRINEIAVYRNGVRLAEGRDFTASDGDTVNLVTAATVDDVIEFAVFDSFNVSDAIVSAASSQNLNGDFNVTGTLYAGTFKPSELVVGVVTSNTALHVGSALTANAAGDVETIGIITAATFKGDGSGLTGIGETVNVRTETITVSGVSTFTGAIDANATTDSTSSTTGAITAAGGVGIAKDLFVGDAIDVTKDLKVGAAATITGALSAGAISGSTGTFSGAVNVDATTDSTSSTSGALIVDGGLGVAKNVYIGAGLSVAGTLTYEDVTNVDSVGMVTAKSGLNVSGGEVTVGSAVTIGSAGVTTFIGAAGVGVTITPSTGKVEATTYYGDGSNLSNITSTTINSNADNRLITGSGTANTLNGETALTFDGEFKVGTALTVASTSGVATFGQDVRFLGADGYHMFWDQSTNQLRFPDYAKATFGQTGNAVGDFRIYTSGTNAYLYAESGTETTYLGGSGVVKIGTWNAHQLSTTNEGLEIVGFTSVSAGMGLTGGLFEGAFIKAGKLSDNLQIGIATANVFYFTTQETTTATPNIRWNDTYSLSSKMAVGDVASVTVITTAAAGGYSANWTIDGNAVTEEWVGGSAPSAGGSDGLDIYSFTIIKTGTGTGDSGFKVIANVSNAT